jgi:hypothetical protein
VVVWPHPAPYIVERIQLPLRHHKMTHISKPHQCVVEFIYRMTSISVNAEPNSSMVHRLPSDARAVSITRGNKKRPENLLAGAFLIPYRAGALPHLQSFAEDDRSHAPSAGHPHSAP